MKANPKKNTCSFWPFSFKFWRNRETRLNVGVVQQYSVLCLWSLVVNILMHAIHLYRSEVNINIVHGGTPLDPFQNSVKGV